MKQALTSLCYPCTRHTTFVITEYIQGCTLRGAGGGGGGEREREREREGESGLIAPLSFSNKKKKLLLLQKISYKYVY